MAEFVFSTVNKGKAPNPHHPGVRKIFCKVKSFDLLHQLKK